MENKFAAMLEQGRVFEKAVKKCLDEMNLDYEVRMTEQEPGSPERDDCHLCDIVLWKDNRKVLGIECKLSSTKFINCRRICGWDGDWNTPINASSYNEYLRSDFPFYVVNINVWCKRVLFQEVHKLPYFGHKDIPKYRNTIYNFDGRIWGILEGNKWTLKDVLKKILEKELC